MRSDTDLPKPSLILDAQCRSWADTLIMRKQTDIPSLLVLFAFFAGSAVAGVLGALVAIPLAGALRVLVVRVAAPVVRRWSGAAGGESP